MNDVTNELDVKINTGDRLHQKITFDGSTTNILEILDICREHGIITTKSSFFANNKSLTSKILEEFDATNIEHREIYKQYILTGNLTKKFKVKPPYLNCISMMQEELIKYYILNDSNLE